MKYPRLWEHKKTKQRVTVVPWWETIEYGGEELNAEITAMAGRTAKFGMLVQIGYLIENEGGVWIGMNLTASQHFKDKGPWKPKKKRAEG